MRHIHSNHRAGFLLAALATSGAFAAGNTPITREPQALRSVLNADALWASVSDDTYTFVYEPVGLVGAALYELNGRTTLADLAAAPEGLTFPCAVSGTLSARLVPGWVRLLQITWEECVLYDLPSGRQEMDGPAEVILLGESLAPRASTFLRLGNRDRDLVRSSTTPRSTIFGSQVSRWNLRALGLWRMDGNGVQGRFAAEVNGFRELTDMLRDTPNPGPPFFPRYWRSTAEGMVITGEFTSDETSSQSDLLLLRGTLAQRIERPPTPNVPTTKIQRSSYRAENLHVRDGADWSLGTSYLRVDGKATVDQSEFYGAGSCPKAETYTYRTREALTSPPGGPYSRVYAGGELEVNGSTVARFSMTSPEDPASRVMHLGISVPRLGTFGYDAHVSIYELAPLAGCTP